MRRVVAGAIALATVAAGAGAVGAVFASDATATLTVSVGAPVVPRPATVNCVGQPDGLSRKAHFTWTAPAGAPQPTQYVLRVLDQGNAVEVARVAGTVTSYDLTTGVLTGALGFLLTALRSGATRPVTVNAVYGSYESAHGYLHHLRSEGTGIGCAAGATP